VVIIFIFNLLFFIYLEIEQAKLTIFTIFVHEGEKEFLPKLIVKQLKL